MQIGIHHTIALVEYIHSLSIYWTYNLNLFFYLFRVLSYKPNKNVNKTVYFKSFINNNNTTKQNAMAQTDQTDH